MNIIIVIIFFSLLYFLLLIEDSPSSNNNFVKPVKEKIKSSVVSLISDDNYIISINDATKSLFLTKDRNLKEKFKIIPSNKKNISLLSLSLNSLICINYTTFYNTEYDVIVSGNNLENNNIKLKLYKKRKYYYIKFYNNYYLSRDNNGNIFASKDKNKILLFRFKNYNN